MLNSWHSTAIIFSLVTIFLSSSSCFAAEPKTASAQQVTALTQEYFSSLPKYQSGNLITQSEVTGLLKEMSKKGWVITPKAKSQLLQRILSDDNFLVKELNKTERGRSFLHKIRNYPGGIDRLDKIAQMPKGKRDVHAMIYKIPDGDQWIKGMTTTERGRRLGNNISRWQRDDFNKKTGRLYTVDQLLPELTKIVEIPQTTTKNQFTREASVENR